MSTFGGPDFGWAFVPLKVLLGNVENQVKHTPRGLSGVILNPLENLISVRSQRGAGRQRVRAVVGPHSPRSGAVLDFKVAPQALGPSFMPCCVHTRSTSA